MISIMKRKFRWMYIFWIVFGTGLIALGVQCIYDRIGLVTGGFSGLAIVIRTVTLPWIEGGVPLWLTNIVLNVPAFAVAWFVMGRKFIGRTLLGTVMLSVWLYLIPPVDLAQKDFLLAAVYGGLFSGLGIGMVIKGRATTGGTDMVAALIQRKLRHYSVAQVMQVLDGLIVLIGLFVFGIRPTLYAVVAIFVTTKVSDAFLDGFHYSKAAYIITEQYEAVAQRIMLELDRGVTGLDARGMYTHREQCMLYCVVSKKEMVAVKEIANEIDPNAFMIVSDVREVLGEGFQEYTKEF